MNEKENKIFFKDLPKVLQKEFADNFNHFCETLRTENINGKYYIVIDELTQLNTNMIQSNELRIGNWVKRNEYNAKFIALSVSGLVAEREDGARYYGAIHALEPIPLTEELIAKCMFSEYEFEDDIFLHDEEDVCVQKSGKVYYPYSFENSDTIGTPIRYLHQLQNLFFALTGKELEIKL